jgi:hypothetical protein
MDPDDYSEHRHYSEEKSVLQNIVDPMTGAMLGNPFAFGGGSMTGGGVFY